MVLLAAQQRAVTLAPLTPPPLKGPALTGPAADLAHPGAARGGGANTSLGSSGSSSSSSSSSSGRNFWVACAHALVERCGAQWDPRWRDPTGRGRTMLHLLFAGPAPPQRDGPLFLRLVASALAAFAAPAAAALGAPSSGLPAAQKGPALSVRSGGVLALDG